MKIEIAKNVKTGRELFFNKINSHLTVDVTDDAFGYLKGINHAVGAVIIRMPDGRLLGAKRQWGVGNDMAVGDSVLLTDTWQTGVVLAEKYINEKAGRFYNRDGVLQAVDFYTGKLVRPGEEWSATYLYQARGHSIIGKTFEYRKVTLRVVAAGEDDGVLWHDFRDEQTGEIGKYNALIAKIDARTEQGR